MLSVENQMKHLALVNYKGFIHTADTSRRIYKDVMISSVIQSKD